MRRLIVLLVILIPSIHHAQIMCHALGNSAFNDATDLVSTRDNGFVICGGYSNDMYVMKLDSTLTIQWERRIGGGSSDYAFSIVETFDNGYAVAGFYGGATTEAYIVKLDSAGNLVWTRTVGGPQNESAIKIIQASDSGLVFCGYTNSFGGSSYNMWVAKLSSTGQLLWQVPIGANYGDYGYSITETADGGYAVAGTCGLNGIGYECYVVKLNSNGNILWNRSIGDWANGTEIGYAIVELADSSLMVAGYTDAYGPNPSNIYLSKMTSSGSVLWMKTIGRSSVECTTAVNMQYPHPVDMEVTPDQNLVIATSTYSFGVQQWDAYFLKIDSAANILWSRTLGGPGTDEAYAVTLTDTGFALVGRTNSFGAGNVDIFLNILDSAGMSCCVSGSGGVVGSGGYAGTNGNGGGGFPNTASLGTINTITAYSLESTCLVCVPPQVNLNLPSAICAGDSVTLTPSVTGGVGSYTYSWVPGGYTTPAITIAPAVTTNYTFTVTDSVNCQTTYTFTINVNPTPVVSVSGFNTICTGQTVTLTASGALDYLWSPTGDTTASIVESPGTSTSYVVTGTDANGCSVSVAHSVNVNACPVLSSFCNSIDLNSSGTEAGYGVVQTNTGDYVIVGTTDNTSTLNTEVYLLKVSAMGYIIWSRTIGGSSDDHGYTIAQTPDDGFIIAGVTSVNNQGILVIKTDSLGFPQWSRGVEIGIYPGTASKVITTTDGGYAVVGYTQDGGIWTDDQVYVIKLDSSGNVTWTFTGGDPNAHDRGYGIVQTSDGGFAVAGETGGYTSGWQNIYVFKLSTSGVLLWSVVYGSWTNDEGRTIMECANGDLLVAGGYHGDPMISRITASGTLQWTRTYYTIQTSSSPCLSMSSTSDGGYIMGCRNTPLIKVDSLFNASWATTETTIGWVQNNHCGTSDGGIIAVGYNPNGISLVKYDAAGNSCCSGFQSVTDSTHVHTVYSGSTIGSGGIVGLPALTVDSGATLTQLCSIITPIQPSYDNSAQFDLYPNPTTGEFIISPNQEGSEYEVVIYNQLGEMIYSSQGLTGESKINLSIDAPGIYTVHIASDYCVTSKRIVLVR